MTAPRHWGGFFLFLAVGFSIKPGNSKGLNIPRRQSDVHNCWTESFLQRFLEDRKVQEQGSVRATLTGLAEEDCVVVDVWGEEEKAWER